jgi:hypothetical protein
MADDPNPILTAQLTAARDALSPLLRGLNNLKRISVSDGLRSKIQEVVSVEDRRQALLNAALSAGQAYLAALVALENDGYPGRPNFSILATLFAEIQAERDELEAAVAIFEPERASVVKIILGQPVPQENV